MSGIRDILTNPHQRTVATYRFKVTAITDNTVSYRDASMRVRSQTLPNLSDVSLEAQYQDHLDNLFLVIDITGQYHFAGKLSNAAQWPGFSE